MRVDPDLDVEVAGRSAVAAGLAFAGKPDPVAIVDARGYLDRQRAGLAHPPAAVTALAGIGNHRARALAGRAGLLDREETLLHADLAGAAAGRTLRGLGALLRAAAVADLAGDLRRHFDRDGIAADGTFEIEPEFVTEIGAPENLRAAAARAAAENIAEYVAEYVAEALRAEPAGAAHAGAAQAVVAEAVVRGPLVAVAQNLVGLLDLLELAVRTRVVLVAVRVVLHGEATIRLLDLVSRSRLRDPQYLVIVAFCHACSKTGARTGRPCCYQLSRPNPQADLDWSSLSTSSNSASTTSSPDSSWPPVSSADSACCSV